MYTQDNGSIIIYQIVYSIKMMMMIRIIISGALAREARLRSTMWCSNSAVVLFTNDNWAPKVRFEKVKLNTMSFLAVVLKKVKVKVLLTTTRVPFLTRCVMLILRI